MEVVWRGSVEGVWGEYRVWEEVWRECGGSVG